MVSVLLALAAVAGAAEPAPASPESIEPSEVEASPAPEAGPIAEASDDTRRGVNTRYRYLWLPKGLLNGWYYPSEETRLPRPNASANVVGAEYVVEPMPATFAFWAEAWFVNLDEGYWDDTDNPPDHSDGDWIRPTGLGMFAVGANFGHEWALTPETNDAWLGLGVSGGLGLGLPWGTIEQWYPGWATEPLTTCEAPMPSDVRMQSCPADHEVKLPPVLPVIDLTLALKLHVMERGLVRLEGGIHDVPYVGVAGGAQF